MTLAAMQIEKLPHEDLHGPRIVQTLALFQRQKVDVVGRVDDIGDPKDAVRHWIAPSELRVVFNVINQKGGIVKVADDVLDLMQLEVIGHVEPNLEAIDEDPPNVLPGNGVNVAKGFEQRLVEFVAF